MSPPTKRDPRIVADMLDDYADLYRRQLSRVFAERSQPFYDLVADYPRRAGRSLRASICIAVAGAFGARPETAAKTACAIELMHSAFLVHDDIEDGSYERRGKPTLHELHGVATAINAGDALAVMALEPLLDNVRVLGPRRAHAILAETYLMARESVEGQAIELAWRANNTLDASADDYLLMVLKKTCYYTAIFPCRLGALVAGRHRFELDRFTRFGFFLGAAFQIQDDLLNLVGDPVRYGKELNGDLYEGKRTLPLVHVLQCVTGAERREVRRILALPRASRTALDVQFLRAQMDSHDAIGYARRTAHALAGAAEHELEAAFANVRPSRELEFVRALPAWVIERT